MLTWVVSGIYLAFPEPFDMVAVLVSGDDLSGIGYQALEWLTYLHFGRFSAAVQIVWVVVGLLPAVLVLTGIGLWWTRRVKRPSAPLRPLHSRVWPIGRMTTTWAAIAAVGCCGWAMYVHANYREERQVERFLEAVQSGQYRQGHAMWDGDEYGFDRFLADWGTGGRHTTDSDIDVIDSTTYGSVVTVYIKTAAPTPVAIRVDKESMLLSYALSNEYGAVAARR
jgi:hypothetical protein